MTSSSNRKARPAKLAAQRLFLHIGTHKTGSTSLQAMLADNGDALRAQGIHYLQAARRDGVSHTPLVLEVLARQGAAAPTDTVPAHWALALAELRANVWQKAIISCEDFSDLGADGVADLARLLASGDWQLEIVVFLRDQLDLLVSNHIELLKQGLIDRDLAGFVSLSALEIDHRFLLRQYDYQVMLEPWLAHFGRERLHVLPYSKTSDTVETFARLVGLDTASLPTAPRRLNVSPPDEVTTVLMVVNRYLLSCAGLSDSRRAQIAYDVYLRAAERYRDSGAFAHEPQGVREVVREYYRDGNQWLHEVLGISFDDAEVTRRYTTETANRLNLPPRELDHWLTQARCDVEYSLEHVS